MADETSKPEAPQPHPAKLPRKREGARSFQPGLWLRLVPAGAVLVYLALFIGLNTHRVKVSFVFSSTRVSLIWVVLLSNVLGLCVGILLSQLYRFRRRVKSAKR